MSFSGAIESLTRREVSGWAGYTHDGAPVAPRLRLRLHTRGVLDAPRLVERKDGRHGFAFALPASVQALSWQEFLAEFDGVIAAVPGIPGVRDWRLPLFKSVLAAFDPENRTTLLAARLKEYALAPKPAGRTAVFTIAYNETVLLPLWAAYYGALFGPENLFVIDQGSDVPYPPDLRDRATIVRVPREMFDNWLIARLVATYQRFLLESYDTVIYCDSDEFLCVDPAVLGGASVADFMAGRPEPIGITTGFDLYHDVGTEAAYTAEAPVLAQRRVLLRNPMMDKPLISRVPLNWVPGFHRAAEGGTKIPGLYLLHLRWFDRDLALRKGGFYRDSAWSAFDVARNIAGYQRAGAAEIVEKFQAMALRAAQLRTAGFDPAATLTVAAAWMRAAVAI